MVEERDELPTPQAGESSNWADLVDFEETSKQQQQQKKQPVGSSAAPSVPVAAANGSTNLVSAPTVTYNKNGDRVETEYRTNPDTGKYEKVVTTYRTETKLVLKSVAARKRLPKFGQSAKDGPGPNRATTQVSTEEINIKFISSRDPNQENEEEMRKLQIGDKLIACRHCSSTTHLTAHCPLKDQMEQYKNLSQDLSGKNPQSMQPVASGSYVPPSLRGKGAGLGGMGSAPRSSDNNCIRVSNLPDTVTEDDLKELFKPFGMIERVFLAKDRITKVSKGFAFVTFKERSSAERAIARVNKHGYDHLILSVEWAQPATRN